MIVGIVPMGTLGDIKPCVALSQAILRKGHSIKLVVPKNGRWICENARVPFETVDIDFDRLAKDGAGKRTKQQQAEELKRMVNLQFAELTPKLTSCDILIGASLQFAGAHIAQHLKIPYFHTYYTIRFLESRSYPPFRFSVDSKGILNCFLWAIYKKISNSLVTPSINEGRRSIGLTPVREASELYQNNLLIASDPKLDPHGSGGKQKFHQTGYWFNLENEHDTRGDKFPIPNHDAVYLGFGSMPTDGIKEYLSLLDRIAHSFGIVFCVPEKLVRDISHLPKTIRPLPYLPHTSVFPTMRAIIHHGGAGTTHTAALCGVPQIIVPIFGDQFYWSMRVDRLGIGIGLTRGINSLWSQLESKLEHILQDIGYTERAQRFSLEMHQRVDGCSRALNTLGL